MSRENLKNKPLIEAIFEMKWAFVSHERTYPIDPHHNLLLGRMYDRVNDKYPFHEPLPAASIPDEIIGQNVKHRFRSAENDWPLLQIGPGILTVNDTEKYLWNNFKEHITFAVEKLFESHPVKTGIKIESLMLRYIDAIIFDYTKNNIIDLLKDKMKISILFSDSLFPGDEVKSKPEHFNFQTSFLCEKPNSIFTLKIATGKSKIQRAIIMETIVHSQNGDVPSDISKISVWVESAHNIIHDWFFKIIKGDLEKEFDNE